ncbi:MAG: hypothetical protein WBD62_00210, partial [Anaerolineales bacterium]
MRIGSHKLKLEKRESLRGWQAASISILAIIVALILFSFIFIFAGKNPLTAYYQIFTYSFANPFGLPLTINRFIFLLLCTCAFIIPYRAGLWNIGMSGQLYAGALAAYAVLFGLGIGASTDSHLSVGILIPLMLIAAALGGSLVGAIAGFFKGKFNI